MECGARQSWDLSRYGKRGACQDHSENCSLTYPLCLTRWDFPFHSQDEIVAQRNLEETWAIVGRRVISRRRDIIQGWGIGVESHG